MTEAEFQSQVIQLARLYGWLIYHTHDSRRSVSGFPDLVLVRERVIWAELKSDAGKVSDDQELWIARLKAAGQETYLWRPADWHEVCLTLERQ